MAEFVEVMRQARRLCETKKCRACPLANRDEIIGISICMLHPSQNNEDDVDYAEVESVIMQWAAEHPEPVYPSWKEWQEKTFPNYQIGICQATFGEECPNPADICSCTECRMQPISAAIAEKLGIRPKEIDE